MLSNFIFTTIQIILCTDKTSVEKDNLSDKNSVKHYPLDEEEKWKVALLKELTKLKFGKLELENFSEEVIEKLISFACTS